MAGGAESGCEAVECENIGGAGMRHVGDISLVNGADIEPVDIITFGSPCTDLSVAGKREGIDAARSGLFFQAIRIIKEMRAHDSVDPTNQFIRPRFALWENVPGAFSSNKGEDFRRVLEEIAHIADEAITIPRPTNGKWSTCGCIVGNGWSIAWKVLDAQYLGVPQRRRRIFLVADFGGECAGDILFEPDCLPGHPTQSRATGQGITPDAERSTGEASGGGIGLQNETSPTIRAGGGSDSVPAVMAFDTTQITSPDNYSNPKWGDPCHPLAAGAHSPAVVYDSRGNGVGRTVNTLAGDHQSRITDYTAIVLEGKNDIPE